MSLQWVWDQIKGNFLWWVIFGIGAFVVTRARRWLTRAWIWVRTWRQRSSSHQPAVPSVAPSKPSSWPDAAGTWFLIFSMIMLSLWNRSLDQQIRRLHIEMARFVLPRTLSEDQKKTIAEFLSHTESQDVVMRVVARDEEAGGFRADIQQALERGGWPVTDIQNADDLQEGVSINFTEPMRQPQTPEEVAKERLHRKQTPAELLSQAFKLADVQIQGGSSGSGQSITKTTLTISVGHRRRDRWAVLPKDFFEQMRRSISEPSDDDFK